MARSFRPIPAVVFCICFGACAAEPPSTEGADAAAPSMLEKLLAAPLPDGAPCTNRNQCRSMACTWFFRDRDGDRQGATPMRVCGFIPPAGFVTVGGDCCDFDARVNRSQRGFFTTPTSCGGFDYDCSGAAQRLRNNVEECTGDACWSGWRQAVPPCGAAGSFMDCRRVGPGPGSCNITNVGSVQQSCR